MQEDQELEFKLQIKLVATPKSSETAKAK